MNESTFTPPLVQTPALTAEQLELNRLRAELSALRYTFDQVRTENVELRQQVEFMQKSMEAISFEKAIAAAVKTEVDRALTLYLENVEFQCQLSDMIEQAVVHDLESRDIDVEQVVTSAIEESLGSVNISFRY